MYIKVIGQHHHATILSFILIGSGCTDIDMGIVIAFFFFVAIVVEHQDFALLITHFHIDPRTRTLDVIVLGTNIQMHHLDVNTS